MPSPSRADTNRTGGCHASPASAPSPSPARSSLALRSASGPEVGLVDGEDVRQLEDPGLHELQRVPGAGLGHEDQAVDQLRRRRTRIARCPRSRRRPCRRRRSEWTTLAKVASARPPRRSRAAMERRKTPSSPGARAHPQAIAQQGAAAALARRVDGDDADALLPLAQRAHQGVEEGRLAGTRCAGDPDAQRAGARALGGSPGPSSIARAARRCSSGAVSSTRFSASEPRRSRSPGEQALGETTRRSARPPLGSASQNGCLRTGPPRSSAGMGASRRARPPRP